MIRPVGAARNIEADIKTLPVFSEFCIDLREITWKYEDFYGNFNGTILEEKQCMKEKS